MLRAILAGRGPNTESADQIPVVTDKGSLMRADAANTNTFRGKRQDAQRELTRLLGAADARVLPEPSKTTISEYLRSWLDGTHGLSPQTTERYRELVELQIIPHLGNIALQKLTPQQIEKWHDVLLSWHPNWHRTARDSRGKHGKAQRQRSRKYGQKRIGRHTGAFGFRDRCLKPLGHHPCRSFKYLANLLFGTNPELAPNWPRSAGISCPDCLSSPFRWRQLLLCHRGLNKWA